MTHRPARLPRPHGPLVPPPPAVAGPAVVLLAAALLACRLASPAAAARPAPTADEPAAGPIAPHLAAALADPGHPAWRADERIAVWVRFADKGLAGAALEAALDRAEARLSRRAARRRARTVAPGGRLVDARDLPLHPAYLAAVAATGARPRERSRWLNAASYLATAAQVRAIAGLPGVRGVDLVRRMRRPEPRLEPADRALPPGMPEAAAPAKSALLDYGASAIALEQIDVPAVHALGLTGAGVLVGLLDTGFRTTHEALAHVPVLAAHDFVNHDDVVDDQAGDPVGSRNHGTEILSSLAGRAPGAMMGPAHGASVVLAKTELIGSDTPIEEDRWVAGLEWAEAQGADIVSSSLGYYQWYEFADLDGNTAPVTVAADLAVGLGVVVVNAAGNQGGLEFEHIVAPADGDSVITAGALTRLGEPASFSSPGPTADGRIKPDVMAPGVSVTVADPDDDTGYLEVGGTSLSCPLTAGVVALMLERAPSLTPMQVREALRMTASRAQAPDNQSGWGTIDALAAVLYWGPRIAHAPLGDSESTVGPYPVTAVIEDRLPLDPGSLVLRYRTDGGPWHDLPLAAAGDDAYAAAVPGQPAGTLVEYYLEAADSQPILVRDPRDAPAQLHSFRVGPDTTPPVVRHLPLHDQTLPAWPPEVTATVSDNLGVDHVELRYQHDGGPVAGPYILADGGGGDWTLPFPLAAADLQVGDHLSYTITAVDASASALQTVSGPHEFDVIDSQGFVLVIDDGAATAADAKLGPDKQPLPSAQGAASAATIAGWLDGAGYTVTTVAGSAAVEDDLVGEDIVVLACGGNSEPIAAPALRDLVRQWAAAGGRLLVEGGEVGADALSSPGYPYIGAEVLHASAWVGDYGGPLLAAPGRESHPLLVGPETVTPPLSFLFAGYPNADVVVPAADAYGVLVASDLQGGVAALVYDDTPAPEAGQVVYLPFSVDALADATQARALVVNAAAFLLAHESLPTASIAGRARLVGAGDHGGILVRTAAGDETLTAADGTFLLDRIYGGTHTVSAAKDGYVTESTTVEVAEGTQATGVELLLRSAVTESYAAQPELAIPDGYLPGVVSTIVVPAGGQNGLDGPLAAVTVDIDLTHTFIGDLEVELVSPAGTRVGLHDNTGFGAEDIRGTWPLTLTVDGPGDLDDLVGESIPGTWSLHVADQMGDDTGVLHSWGLGFTLLGPVSAVGEDGPPAVTRLLGGEPNPFNPRTTIRFELAGPGPARLEIFDLRGRLVRRLVDARLAAGPHAEVWDGRDDAGRAVGGGAYLARLRAGGRRECRKLMLVR